MGAIVHRFNENPIKIERYILIGRDGGSIAIRPSSSIYLLLPSDLAKKLKWDFGLDLKDDKNIEKHCTLALENEENKTRVRIIYDFWKPAENRQLKSWRLNKDERV